MPSTPTKPRDGNLTHKTDLIIKRDGRKTVPAWVCYTDASAGRLTNITINNPFHHHQAASWDLCPSPARR